MELQGLKDKILPVLERYEVKRAAAFGSFVRGEQKENSDIDILIEFKGTKSLLDLAGLKIELEETLDRKVDVLNLQVAASSAQRQNPKRTKSDPMNKDME